MADTGVGNWTVDRMDGSSRIHAKAGGLRNGLARDGNQESGDREWVGHEKTGVVGGNTTQPGVKAVETVVDVTLDWVAACDDHWVDKGFPQYDHVGDRGEVRWVGGGRQMW